MSSDTSSYYTEDFSSVDTPFVIIRKKSSKFYPVLFIIVAIILIIGTTGIFIIEIMNMSNLNDSESITYIIDKSMFNEDILVLNGRLIELTNIDKHVWSCSGKCHYRDGSGWRSIVCLCNADNIQKAISICEMRYSSQCLDIINMSCK